MSATAVIERPRSVHPLRLMAGIALAGIALALAVVALPGPALAHQPPAGGAAGPSGTAVGLLNESRAANGIAPLAGDPELQGIADRQAGRMAESGSIFHSGDLGGQLSSGWWAWAENVGYGASVGSVHGAFMNSGYHASNILDASYNYVGVGVAYGSDGNVYVAQVFGAW